MQSFLKDAEQKQSRDQRVQQWVFEINSIANDVVAILKTYNFEGGKSDDIGFASCLKKLILQMSPRCQGDSITQAKNHGYLSQMRDLWYYKYR